MLKHVTYDSITQMFFNTTFLTIIFYRLTNITKKIIVGLKRNLPKMIEKILNRLSTDSQIFDNAKHSYQTALRQSDFKHEIKYENKSKTNSVGNKKRKQTRKIMFFNPPYCQSVKTNIGKEFLHLIDEHFKNVNMKKVFNRNNCKASYSCMKNLKSLISRHSKSVLSRANNKNNQKISTCNCRDNDSCPSNGKCLQENVVYKATVTTQNESKGYIIFTGGTFKKRAFQVYLEIKNK